MSDNVTTARSANEREKPQDAVMEQRGPSGKRMRSRFANVACAADPGARPSHGEGSRC